MEGKGSMVAQSIAGQGVAAIIEIGFSDGGYPQVGAQQVIGIVKGRTD